MSFGRPPSKLRVSVALSPTVTLSRSRVAVKVAENKTLLDAKKGRVKKTKARKLPRNRVRRKALMSQKYIRIYVQLIVPVSAGGASFTCRAPPNRQWSANRVRAKIFEIRLHCTRLTM